MSTLVITPTGTCKGATLAGCVAVREAVAVRLIGLGPRVPEGFILRVLRGGVPPLALCEQWTAAASQVQGAPTDALGVMNLNTNEMIAALDGTQQGHSRTFSLVLWSLTLQDMVIDTTVQIRANHASEGESNPQPVAPWGTDLTAVLADVAELQAAIMEHAHAGADSVRVAHGDLTGAGVMSHGAIEAALVNLAGDLNWLADRTAIVEAWRASAAAGLQAAADALASIAGWRATATTDLAGVQVAVGNLAARLDAIAALPPADLGWSVGDGEVYRAISGDHPSYGELVRSHRTLVMDLKSRGVI